MTKEQHADWCNYRHGRCDCGATDQKQAALTSNEWGGVEKLAQQRNDALAEVERLRGAFKNFHRLLCERFGYCHDENDWQRDQLSLIEHIAKRIAVETTDVTRMRNTLVQSGYTDCGGELWKPPLGRRPVFLDENLRLLDLVARMLPYVQQSDPADFADIEAATAIGREAMEALATIRPEEPAGPWETIDQLSHQIMDDQVEIERLRGALKQCRDFIAPRTDESWAWLDQLLIGSSEEPPRCIHRAVVCEKCAAMAVRNFEKSAEPSPDQLVGALQDRVHKEIGVTRPGRAVKAAEPIPTQEWIDKSQGLTGLEYDANGERLPEKAPCERCEGSGRLTIYDTATYVGQACSPIGDEPCPECQPENGYGER